MFCCMLLYIHSSFAIILMELVALLGLSSWCLVIVVWLFLAVPWVCLRFVIVVYSDHTHLLLVSFIRVCELEGSGKVAQMCILFRILAACIQTIWNWINTRAEI